ncbi:hypothetical protein ACF0H5_014188 [Mactra antiquata]
MFSGSLMMFNTATYNIRTRLRAFIILPTDLCFAWITNINYWTYQQAGSETCEEVNVIVWTDLTNNYTIPIMITLLIQCIYLWMRLAVIDQIRNTIQERFAIGVFFLLTLVDLACLVGIFPAVFSEISYWFHAVIYTTAITLEMLTLCDLDIKMMRRKINELRELAGNEENRHHKNKLLEDARILDQQIPYREAGDWKHYNLPGKWFMQDCLSVSAIIYFMFAWVIEVIVGYDKIGDIFHVEFILFILVRWSTSAMSLVCFCSLFNWFSHICVGICFHFLTTDSRVIIEEMIYYEGGPAHIATLLLFAESNYLGLAYVEREQAMQLVLWFSLYIVCGQIRDAVERRVMYVHNSGPGFSFFRLSIFVGLVITVPSTMTYFLSQNLATDFLSLFFASSNMNIVFLSLFLIVDCSFTSLMGHTIQYRYRIEEILHKMRFIKTGVLAGLIFNQAYYRYYCPFFKAWWFYRLALTMLSSCLAAGTVLYAEWIRHKKRQQLNMIMSRLPEVNYDGDGNSQSTDCPICLFRMTQGVILPCQHSFHKECLRLRLQIQQVCPTCNVNV